MKKMKILVAVFLVTMSHAALAGKYNLINRDMSPSIASSNKSLGEGKHEFVIDQSKKLSGKKDITFEFLKMSIETKLGTTYGAKVSGDVKKIVVEYDGDEASFLKAIARTRIKTRFDVKLARAQVGGDMGYRAQGIDNAIPAPTEVFGLIASVKKEFMTVTVLKVGGKGMSKKLKKMPTKITPVDGRFKKGDAVFFVPVKKAGGMWEVKNMRKHK